jgi:hypothetical protein
VVEANGLLSEIMRQPWPTWSKIVLGTHFPEYKARKSPIVVPQFSLCSDDSINLQENHNQIAEYGDYLGKYGILTPQKLDTPLR